VGQSLHGLLGRAGEGLSALKEKLQWEWIDHSALVRKLLREFREGDPSQALRHAFSMAPADPRHRLVQWGNRLPWNRAIYNLFDLLAGPSRGQPLGVWRAQHDLMQELTQEYRKAAERALRQGDFRRAAYIYGKLLGHDRQAASALQRGGLHRDAAILYLKKLNDPASAAQAFEAAGEVDRAIDLYRRLGQHESAGDLLLRIGEQDAALGEYLQAAELLVAADPPDYLAAGKILDLKARRSDLAIRYFQQGWDRRPNPNEVLCAIELMGLHAARGAVPLLRTLIDQAQEFFAWNGSDPGVSQFYNALMAAGLRSPALAPFIEELRDRSLLAMANQLRHNLERGRAASASVAHLFGGTDQWPSALVRDAEFAASAAPRSARTRDHSSGADSCVEGVQVGHGTVTAACQAIASDELFLGFESGLVLGYSPRRNQIVLFAQGRLPVASLAVDPDGQTVVVLRRSDRGAVISCCVRRPNGSFRSRPDDRLATDSQGWLTPILPWGVDWLVGVGDGHRLSILDAVSGTHRGRLTIAYSVEDPPATALLLPAATTRATQQDQFGVLTHLGARWILLDVHGQLLHQTAHCWRPAAPGPGGLQSVPLSWRYVPPLLDLVGLDEHGAVYSAQFSLENGRFDLLASRVATTEGGYLAATRCGTSLVVAVSRSRIDWLSNSTDRFQPVHKLNLSLPSTVACFPSSSPQEILAVGSDGFVARIAAPRRLRTSAAGG
jgi:tetratricopeptide (TPR) repeat protein